MKIDRPLIDRILQEYPEKYRQWSDLEPLETGFHSDNVKITTIEGDLVLRNIKDEQKIIQRMMYIYDFLCSKGFPTARPIKTEDGNYFTSLVDQHYAIQQYIPGKLITTKNKDETIKITQNVAKNMGTMHSILQEIDFDQYNEYSPEYKNQDTISWLQSVELRDDGIYFPSIKKSMKHEYIANKYREWLEELENMDLSTINMGLCHNDPSLNIYRFDDEQNIIGVLDFGDAEFNYILYDIASYMMYVGMFKMDIADFIFKTFMHSYLEYSPMDADEVRYLRFFIKSRFLIQVFYFFTRLEMNLLQGVENAEGNQKGFDDGVSMLKELDEIPKNYYQGLLG